MSSNESLTINRLCSLLDAHSRECGCDGIEALSCFMKINDTDAGWLYSYVYHDKDITGLHYADCVIVTDDMRLEFVDVPAYAMDTKEDALEAHKLLVCELAALTKPA